MQQHHKLPSPCFMGDARRVLASTFLHASRHMLASSSGSWRRHLPQLVSHPGGLPRQGRQVARRYARHVGGRQLAPQQQQVLRDTLGIGRKPDLRATRPGAGAPQAATRVCDGVCANSWSARMVCDTRPCEFVICTTACEASRPPFRKRVRHTAADVHTQCAPRQKQYTQTTPPPAGAAHQARAAACIPVSVRQERLQTAKMTAGQGRAGQRPGNCRLMPAALRLA